MTAGLRASPGGGAPGVRRSALLTVLAYGAPVEVQPGPLLLAGAGDGPGLRAHRARRGGLELPDSRTLAGRCAAVGLGGRGGAGFPFARKLETARGARGRPAVVVNVSEGEPASLKDAVLATLTPHLVLDGAVSAAHAIRAREVHLVTARDAVDVRDALQTAVRELTSDRREPASRLRFSFHEAAPVFVAGQSSAVLEVMAGRPNLPVTTWRPSAESGHRGRPTLLSNAETYAVGGLLSLPGHERVGDVGGGSEGGTVLLTLDGDRCSPAARPRVVEVPYGTMWGHVLEPHRLAEPVLVGGYHGTWARPGQLQSLTVSRLQLSRHGLTLGAGIVLPTDGACPVTRTTELLDYLAGQSARRCGPCLNGLPALAAAFRRVATGARTSAGVGAVQRLAALVDGRGACSHPDGTARLARSLLAAYPDEVLHHAAGLCTAGAGR